MRKLLFKLGTVVRLAAPFLVTFSACPAEWYVATDGTAAADGTKSSPWELQSTLQGERTVQPGDTIWISGGIYRHPNRKTGAMGYEVRLAGTAAKPVRVRASSNQRVTIDGGLSVMPPSTHLWLSDLEIIVSENFTMSRRIEEPGSHPQSYNRPAGGLHVYSGTGCKFINLVIHDNAQGVSWWAESKDSEVYGCIIYNNGWDAPDRGHGHAIYTQNNEGQKTIADCIMTGGYSYTLHAYGSSRADINNYLVTGNIFYDGGPFLIGGGKPSHGIQVLTNYLYGVRMQLGYSAPYNEDCVVLGNVLVNSKLEINKYRRVQQEGNIVLSTTDPRPSGLEVVLRPNQYDSNRAHLIVFNWAKKAPLEFEPGSFLKPGDAFRLFTPTNLFGEPAFGGIFEGKKIALPLTNEFSAFVMRKDPKK